MPRYWEIREIAKVTIDTLKMIGVVDCCFVGSMACKLYANGKGRQPKDLDILCLGSWSTGDIQQRLCEEDDHFYTVPARDPEDRFKVLHWRTDSGEPGFRKFKIDILVPGAAGLPDVDPRYIIKIDKFPCAPLVLLLFHKLLGWDKRRGHLLAKIPSDEQDIGRLLRIANERGLNLTKFRPYISRSFRKRSRNRVVKFSKKFPQYIPLWTGLKLPDSLFEELL